jgi:hypothetical protein
LKFQNTWVAKLPWAKNVLSKMGLSHMFRATFA